MLLDVQADGNCCFRAFAATWAGHVAFEDFHAQFRQIASAELMREDESYGKRIKTNGCWAGPRELNASGNAFAAKVIIFHGGLAGMRSVVGALHSRREINVLPVQGHWYGLLGLADFGGAPSHCPGDADICGGWENAKRGAPSTETSAGEAIADRNRGAAGGKREKFSSLVSALMKKQKTDLRKRPISSVEENPLTEVQGMRERIANTYPGMSTWENRRATLALLT